MEFSISDLQKENVKFSCLRTPKIISLLNGLKRHFCASLIAQLVKNPPVMQETLVQFLGRKDLLEKGIGYSPQYS